MADGNGGLEIWDVTNSATPGKLGSYFTPGYKSHKLYLKILVYMSMMI